MLRLPSCRMGRNQNLKKPCEYVQPGAQWPGGPLEPKPPPEALLIRGIAQKLEARGARKNVYKIAKRCGLTPQTIYNVLDGQTWPDLVTIARLEAHFRVRLWGNEHRKKPQDLPEPPAATEPPSA